MSAPLSKAQKSLLAREFDRAFNRAAALARGRGEAPDTTSAARERFRHKQVAAATGKRGLRCCSNADFSDCLARAQHLCGEDGRAMNTLIHGDGNRRRIAEHVLVQEMQKASLPPAYVEKICMTQNKCRVFEASEKQLWHLVYTVRNRASAKRKTESGKAGKPANIIPLSRSPALPLSTPTNPTAA